jgi:hypothetical protein
VTRTERTIAIPTGMIIAALYVILLVGFSRESYMRRDAMMRMQAAELAPGRVSGRACRTTQPACASLVEEVAEPETCLAPVESSRTSLGEQVRSLSVDELRQALGNWP